MHLRSHSNINKSLSSKPTTSSNNIVEETRDKKKPPVELLVGLPQRAKGKRGANQKSFLRCTVAIRAKLKYTAIFGTNEDHLRIKTLLEATNDVFKLAYELVPAVAGTIRQPKVLKETTLRRKCYVKDYKKKTPKAYMGVPYEKLDGKDENQMSIYKRHVEATGLSGLIEWLSKVVLAQIDNPGSAKIAFENKVFTEYEKRALRIEIVGIKALNQKVDEEIETTATATASSIPGVANNPSEMTVFGPIVAIKGEETLESMLEFIKKDDEAQAAMVIDAGEVSPWDAHSAYSPVAVAIGAASLETTTPSPLGNLLAFGASPMMVEAPPSMMVSLTDFNSIFLK